VAAGFVAAQRSVFVGLQDVSNRIQDASATVAPAAGGTEAREVKEAVLQDEVADTIQRATPKCKRLRKRA
jgi:hypothetical protein